MSSTAGHAVRRRRLAPKSPEDRLTDLIEASFDTFRSLGLDAATVADITERAGVAKGTFYLYFPSKDHALGAIWSRYVDGFLSRAAELVGGEDPRRDWWPVLDRAVDGLVRHAVAHADLHRMVYRSANGRALEQCRQANERVIVLLTDVVRRAAASGQVEVTDPATVTRFVYHGLHGLLGDVLDRDAAHGADLDVEALVRSATALAHRALGRA